MKIAKRKLKRSKKKRVKTLEPETISGTLEKVSPLRKPDIANVQFIELPIEFIGYLTNITKYFHDLKESHEARCRKQNIIPGERVNHNDKIVVGLPPVLVYQLADIHQDFNEQLNLLTTSQPLVKE